MSEERLPLDDIGELAEEAMSDKGRESDNEAQTRELYDVPTEPARDLAAQQAEDSGPLA